MMQVQIAGYTVEVKEKSDLPEGVNGECRPSDRVIFLRDSLGDEEKSAVLFHELVHFLWYRLFGNAETCNEEEACRLGEFFSTLSSISIVTMAPDLQGEMN